MSHLPSGCGGFGSGASAGAGTVGRAQARVEVQLVKHRCSRFQIFKNRGKQVILQGFSNDEIG